MKKLLVFVAVLCAAMLSVTCSSPNSSVPGTNGQYTLTATVDGASFSSGAIITISIYPIDTSKRLVDIEGTSASLGYSIELSFLCPSVVTAAITMGPGDPYNVVGKYYQGSVGSSVVWISGDTASVTVNSFSVGPADTTISVDFSYEASGGAPRGTQSVKNISAGTLRKK